MDRFGDISSTLASGSKSNYHLLNKVGGNMPKEREELTIEEWEERAEKHRLMLVFAYNLLEQSYNVDAIRKILWRHLMRHDPHISAMGNNEFDVEAFEKWLGELKITINMDRAEQEQMILSNGEMVSELEYYRTEFPTIASRLKAIREILVEEPKEII